MYKSTAMLLDELCMYKDPFGKIKRLISDGILHQITKAIYETDGELPGYLFAPAIYGPSYLSFDYSLSRYGLIPETVREYTSASFAKGKRKHYSNDFGDYSYRDVPKDVYPFEQIIQTEKGYTYSIATAEKAICDKLYTLPPVRNLTEMGALLFEDLRIDEMEFARLNSKTIADLSPLYGSNNVRFLAKLMRRRIEI